MSVYLIHFEQRYKHAGHYIGYSSDLAGRIRAHRENEGARLLQVVNEAGIAWEVVRVWQEGDYALERALKARKNAPQLCPICNPTIAREVPNRRERGAEHWLEVSVFAAWLSMQEGFAIVGNADSSLDCPLCWWFASLFGGVWQVNAAQYRWREQEWLSWSGWQPLPPWAIVFLDGLSQHYGNCTVLAAQALEVLRWSVVELSCWEQVRNRRIPARFS